MIAVFSCFRGFPAGLGMQGLGTAGGAGVAADVFGRGRGRWVGFEDWKAGVCVCVESYVYQLMCPCPALLLLGL